MTVSTVFNLVVLCLLFGAILFALAGLVAFGLYVAWEVSRTPEPRPIAGRAAIQAA